MMGKGGDGNTRQSNSEKLSQAAAEDGGGADTGARWQRLSPGLPGGHRGQLGAARLEVMRCEGINISGNFTETS